MQHKYPTFWSTLNQHIGPHHFISAGLNNDLLAGFEPITMPRRALLQTAGEPAEWIYFLVDGLAVAFATVDSGDVYKRKALYLYQSGHFLLPFTTIPDTVKSLMDVELADDTELLRLPYEHYVYLMQTYPEFDYFDQQYRLQSTKEWIETHAILRTMRTVTDRMLWLYTQYPDSCLTLSDQIVSDIIGGFSREIVCKNRPRVIEMYQYIKRDKL